MTAINIYRLPQVAYLFSDGVSYDLEGRLGSISSKTHIFSSLNCAMLFSGRAILTPYIVHLLEREASSFDHLMEVLPYRLEGMIDELTNLFGIDKSPAAKGTPQGIRAFVAGWSEQRGETVAFNISSVEDAAGRPPFEICERPDGFQSPPVTSEENARGFGGSFTVTPDTIENVAETILELQRHQRWADGNFNVGGLVELVTVKRDSITTKILKRWDEDVIGEKIQPSPIDWAAWRARRVASAAATIPEGLSRLQRERMEKKARKGTLRAV